MDVRFLLMADLANVDGIGKLNMVGVFGGMRPQVLPHIHPLMYLVMVMEFSPSEVGQQRTLHLSLVDQDGKIIFGLPPLDFTVPSGQPGSPIELPAILQINQLVISSYGPHNWDLRVDKDTKKTLTLHIIDPAADQPKEHKK